LIEHFAVPGEKRFLLVAKDADVHGAGMKVDSAVIPVLFGVYPPLEEALMPAGKFPAACREKVLQFWPLIPRCLRRGSLLAFLMVS
jgi:hypothetical protein